MAGHSKWKKIKRKKGAADAKRGKIFTQLIRELTVCARKGGGDPDFNPGLRVAMAAARQANMPNDNIDRAIKKGTGELEGITLEEVTYEGYGPGGVAMIVEVITDNKNRTVSEIRSCFTKYKGNLAATGAVSWMFTKKGIITIDKKACEEDTLMDVILEAGAEDMSEDEDQYEVHTTAENFEKVRDAIDKNKIKMISSEIDMIPQSTIHLDGKSAEQMLKLMEVLEDHDDVQKVDANFDIDDSVIEKMAS